MTTPGVLFAALLFVALASDGFTQTTSTPTGQGGLVLDRGWATPMQGGGATMQDLGVLLSPFAKPAVNIAPAPGLKIFEGVTYLMPYDEARKALNLTQKVVAKNKLACPGFPRDSFFNYGFDGNFDGHFNKLYLVVDKADQVVAVQLVAEKPQMREFGIISLDSEKMEWHTYNFVSSKSKGSTRLLIEFKQFFLKGDRWTQYRPTVFSMQPKDPVEVLRLDSILVNPGSGETTREQRALEAVRLYLPRPMMELILQCIQTSKR